MPSVTLPRRRTAQPAAQEPAEAPVRQRRRGEGEAAPPKPPEEFFVAGSAPPELDEAFDYERDMEIDPDALDAEFLDHARITMRYAEQSAIANREMRMADERVKTKRAELIKETMGTEFGKNAATQEAYYRTDEDYKRLKQEYVDACYIAEILENSVRQFASRKIGIEKLVYLTGIGYNAMPKEPRNLKEASDRLREQREASTQSTIRERMNRR